MIATGHEPTLPPGLAPDASPSLAAEDPAEYVETIRQRLQLTHQQMAIPPAAPTTNPYQIGSLIFALTIPPESTSKLAPRWKGPYRVCRIPNEYQVVYEDGEVERTIHINHVKPAKFTTPDLPEPVPRGATPTPGVSPRGFHSQTCQTVFPSCEPLCGRPTAPSHSNRSSHSSSSSRSSQSKYRTRSTSPTLS